MRHLIRFRNWLVHIYDAWLRFRGPFGASGLSDGDAHSVEKVQAQSVLDVTLTESVAIAPAQSTDEPTEMVEAFNRSGTSATGNVTVASDPKKVVREARFTDAEYVTPRAEPKETIGPANKVVTVPREPDPVQSSAVTHSRPEISERMAESKPQQEVKPKTKRQTNKDGTGNNSVAPPVKATKVEVPKKPVAQKPATVATVEKPALAGMLLSGEHETSTSRPTIRSARRQYAEQTTDQAAQRLARLLISEIKLYNKAEADRATHNVYDILKDPIDKARKYYGQRLGATVETLPDYFYAELVRLLCDGDPSRLGPNYKN
jgi:hypothetical protein